MTNCCEDKACEVSALRESHSRVLWTVLAVNALMFVVEGAAGLYAGSTSLMADALDMLGDSLVYGFSLLVLTKSARWQAGAAAIKGAFMMLFGLAVLIQAAYKVIHPAMPGVLTMGAVGALALTANLACFFLLYSHRADNLNMRSTWLCSRNDLIANVGVLLAAGASYLLSSAWPDLVVGGMIAALFLTSACKVLRESMQAIRSPAQLQTARVPVGSVTIEIRRQKPGGS